MAGEAVVVGVRVRPFNERETKLNAVLCVEMNGPQTILTSDKGEHKFTFDESFWSHDGFDSDSKGFMTPTPGSNYADQTYVFETFGKRVLDNAWDGFHCCLFAYGQTGSGKSYSMVGYGANKGIVPISCEEIFTRIDANTNKDKVFEVTVSLIEIYNEAVQDLLINPKDRPQGGLEIRESKLLGIYIDGVIKRPVPSYKAIEAVIDEATQHRTVGSTLMNATSSRAHTVTIIEFKQTETIGGKKCEKVSMINLVDLAGSEKAGQTGAKGDRLKEGAAINKSLSALGNVIEKLAAKSQQKKGKGKDILVPYRDSKLTRLLQNALGGSSKTIMICALSPASSNAEETLSTLRYADRAKKIKNNAVINENPQEKLIREMREENEKLKAMWEAVGAGGAGAVDLGAMKEKEEELEAAKEALAEMEKSFQQKLTEAAEQKERRASTRAPVAHQGECHILNLNQDPQMNGKVKFYFADRKEPYRIGQPGGMAWDDSDSDSSTGSRNVEKDEDEDDKKSNPSEIPTDTESDSSDEEEPPDYELMGDGIHAKHATVTVADGACYLDSAGKAAEDTYVNGWSITYLKSKKKRGSIFAAKSDDSGSDKDEEEEEKDEKQESKEEEKESAEATAEGGKEAPRGTTLAIVPPGVKMNHGDIICFSRTMFVFVNPSEGQGEMLILSGQVSFGNARKQLKANSRKEQRELAEIKMKNEAKDGLAALMNSGLANLALRSRAPDQQGGRASLIQGPDGDEASSSESEEESGHLQRERNKWWRQETMLKEEIKEKDEENERLKQALREAEERVQDLEANGGGAPKEGTEKFEQHKLLSAMVMSFNDTIKALDAVQDRMTGNQRR